MRDPSQLKGNFPNYWAGCYAAPSRGVKTTRRHDPRPRRPPGSREVPTSDETALDRGDILAIVRFHEPAELDPILAALMDGGIEMLEVTLDTPGALDAVRRASEAGTFIGAGTVLTSDEVRRAADAGARFVVSPAVIPEVITTALALGLTPVPGAFSPTEVQLARSLGAGTIKLFPASTGGPAHLRALRGPFDGVRFVPTGGIGIDDIGAYLAAGAACVGMGTTLTGAGPPRSGDDLDRIRDRAAAAVSAAGEARPEPAVTTPFDVIALGETMLSLVATDGPLASATRFHVTHGGAETNTLVGLSRLGLRTAWVSRLGTDVVGDRIHGALADEGIDLRWTRRDDHRPTGVMIRDTHGCVEYRRAGSAASALSVGDLEEVPVADGPRGGGHGHHRVARRRSAAGGAGPAGAGHRTASGRPPPSARPVGLGPRPRTRAPADRELRPRARWRTRTAAPGG